MNVAEFIATAVPQPSCEAIEVELGGSKDLRRTLWVHRSRYGGITIYLRLQRPRKAKRPLGDEWFRSMASASVSSRDVAEQISIRYYKGQPALWIGAAWFDLLAAEADELAAKFGFKVHRELQLLKDEQL